jgi:hypothetical protein
MPRIAEFFGIVVTMYTNDHAPPHFHAKYGEHKVLVEIETLEIYAGSLPGPQMRSVIEWARENQGMLRNRWAELNGGLGR